MISYLTLGALLVLGNMGWLVAIVQHAQRKDLEHETFALVQELERAGIITLKEEQQ
jgi:hypothetical protein